MASGILSPNSPILPNTAAVIAFFPLLTGVTALVKPTIVLDQVEWKVPAGDEPKKITDNLMKLFGMRDVFLGATMLTVWYWGDRKLTGLVLLYGCVAASADGVIQMAQVGRGTEWKHWGFVPPMLAVAGGLLGWFDGLVKA